MMTDTITVFVSSTFRDMHAERDYLRNVVVPEVREWLSEQRLRLEVVDLRWGVDPSFEHGGRAQAAILDVCFREIRRCSPFFIALLGERYGWRPSRELVALYPYLARYPAGVSVTEMEIEEGLLRPMAATRAVHGFAYLRDPLRLDRLPPAEAQRFSDRAVGNGGDAQKLEDLRTRLSLQVPSRVRRYEAHWDPQQTRLSGLEDFGSMVVRDLQSAVRAHLASQHRTPPRPTEALIAQLVEVAVGRESALVDLRQHFAGDQPHATCLALIAPSGMGKSTVVALLVKEISTREDVLVLVNMASSHPDARHIDAVLSRWCDELQVRLRGTPGIADAANDPNIDQRFARLIEIAARDLHVVVVMDGVDEMENSALARHFAWIPEGLPPRVQFLISATDDSRLRLLRTRISMTHGTLVPLGEADAARVVAAACARQGRSIPSVVSSCLLGKYSRTGDGARSNPLWLVGATDYLNDIGGDEFIDAEQRTGSPGSAVRDLLLKTAEQMPNDLSGLYQAMLARLENRYGLDVVARFTRFVAVSRAGLRASDLDVLMPTSVGEKWNSLTFARLRRSLATHMQQRVGGGCWCFHREELRAEIRIRYMCVDGLGDADVHGALADHLDGLAKGDPVKPSAAYHALRSGKPRRIGGLIVRKVRFHQHGPEWREVARFFVDQDTCLDSRLDAIRAVLLSIQKVREARSGRHRTEASILQGLIHYVDVAVREDVTLQMRALWLLGCMESVRYARTVDAQTLGSLCSRLARVALRMGDYAAALSLAAEGIEMYSELASVELDGTSTRVIVGGVSMCVADAASIEHAMDALLSVDLSALVLLGYLVVLERTQAAALSKLGDHSAARAALARARSTLAALSGRRHRHARLTTTVELAAGDVEMAAHAPRDAMVAFERALQAALSVANDPEYGSDESLGDSLFAKVELSAFALEARIKLGESLLAVGDSRASAIAKGAIAEARSLARIAPGLRRVILQKAAALRLISRAAPGAASVLCPRGASEEAAELLSWLSATDPLNADVSVLRDHAGAPVDTVAGSNIELASLHGHVAASLSERS